VGKFPSLVFFNEDLEDDYFKMMKKSFTLPLNKKELFKTMNLKYDSKYTKLKDLNMDEFKTIVSESKNNRQNILLFFQDNKVNLFYIPYKNHFLGKT